MPELPNEGQKPSQIASSAAGSLPEVHSLSLLFQAPDVEELLHGVRHLYGTGSSGA